MALEFQIELEFAILGEGKTSRSKGENQQQTQPTFDAESGNRTRAILVGGLRGRRMLNHCAIPAPQLEGTCAMASLPRVSHPFKRQKSILLPSVK